jgi:hypothetical protein
VKSNAVKTSENLLFSIRSQMLYPVELRAPLEEQVFCGGRAQRSNNAKKIKDFRPLSGSETNCSRRVMESIARNRPPYDPSCAVITKRCGQESTGAEFSAHTSANNKLTSVYSRNSTTGEEL